VSRVGVALSSVRAVSRVKVALSSDGASICEVLGLKTLQAYELPSVSGLCEALCSLDFDMRRLWR